MLYRGMVPGWVSPGCSAFLRPMNWLDWMIIAVVAYAALRGFMRGFLVELASLVGIAAGVWVALHFSEQVSTAIGLGTKNAAIAFLITLLVVVVAVHFLARFLTTLVDVAQLGLPNKLGGLFLGALRTVFMLSVAFNMVVGYTGGELPPSEAREGSTLFVPVEAFAPFFIPAVGGTKWVQRAVDRVQQEAEGLLKE